MYAQITTSENIQKQTSVNVGFESGKYIVRFAKNWTEITKALELRFRVFNEELGAELSDPLNLGIDYDVFDESCVHLIVIEKSTNEVIGTYRFKHSMMAEHSIGFYTAQEFSIHLFYLIYC